MNGKYLNCVLVNEQYHEASVELKSLRLINKILQEETKSLRSQKEEIKASREELCSPFKREKTRGLQCSGDVNA